MKLPLDTSAERCYRRITMKRKTMPGCQHCQGWATILVSRSMSEPHEDLACGSCGTSERKVYLAIKAGR